MPTNRELSKFVSVNICSKLSPYRSIRHFGSEFRSRSTSFLLDENQSCFDQDKVTFKETGLLKKASENRYETIEKVRKAFPDELIEAFNDYIRENTEDLEFDINEDDKIDVKEFKEKIKKLKEEIEEDSAHSGKPL